MKVKYFEGFVLDALGRAGIPAQTFAAAGYSDKPFGVQVNHGGVNLLVQFVRTSSPNEDKAAAEEYTPGDQAPIAVPQVSGKPVSAFEQILAHVLKESGHPEVAETRTLSRPGSPKAGVEVACTDGSKLYALVVRASGSGVGRHPDYEIPDTLL